MTPSYGRKYNVDLTLGAKKRNQYYLMNALDVSHLQTKFCLPFNLHEWSACNFEPYIKSGHQNKGYDQHLKKVLIETILPR